MKKRMNTKKLVYIGLLAARCHCADVSGTAADVFVYAAFLETGYQRRADFDWYLYVRPAAGIFISLVKDLIHLLSSQTGGVGELSDFLIYTAFSLSAGFLYRYHKSKKGALLACLSGTAAVTVVGALTNRFLIIPFYSKLMPIDAIVSACNAVNPMIDSIDGYILFGAMPFNLIKGLIISALTFMVYKKLSHLMKDSLMAPEEKKSAAAKE